MFYLIPSLSNPSIPLPSPAPFRFLLFFLKLRLAWKADNSIFDNTSSYSLPPFSLFFPLSPSLFFELVLVHGARRPLRGALEVFRDPPVTILNATMEEEEGGRNSGTVIVSRSRNLGEGGGCFLYKLGVRS